MTQDQLDQLAFSHLTTAVLLLDQRLRVLHANPAAESLLAVGASQLHATGFNHWLADDTAERELREALRTESPHTHRETQLRLPAGKPVTIDLTATPIGDRRLLLEIQPIDRILRINREEALLAAQATSQELVRGLAHEIKNPLGGIKGAAQLLAMELSREQREYTDVVIAETERLSRLVDQLLGPTRPLQLAALNIHQITEHVATLIDAESHSGEQPAVAIARDYDPSIPDLLGDAGQLIQAVLNIARNAKQALDATSGDTITFRTRIQRHFTIGKNAHRMVLRLDIEDNGPGIPDDIAERIFYPMISGRSGGTGLGLPISQTIISRHRGLIECSSRPGCTRFSVYLPLTQPSENHHD